MLLRLRKTNYHYMSLYIIYLKLNYRNYNDILKMLFIKIKFDILFF